jgi:hypothetical protein
MFDLTFLGTSVSVPSAERNHPGLLVEAAYAYRKSSPDILVMQSAQDRSAKNVSAPLHDARYRRIFLHG